MRQRVATRESVMLVEKREVLKESEVLFNLLAGRETIGDVQSGVACRHCISTAVAPGNNAVVNPCKANRELLTVVTYSAF